MRQVLVIVAIAALFSFGSSCSKKAANTESANTNSAESPFAGITDANAAIAEGDRLFDENQTEMAIQAYKRAIELDPDLGDAHFKLAVAYSLLEKQRQQAGQEAGTAEVKKSNSDKEYEKAVEAYRKYLKNTPNDDSAHYNLARALSKLLKDDEAEDEFRAAARLKPDDTEYQTDLGDVLIKLAKYHEAIPPLKKALELDPDNARAADLLEDAEAGRQRIDYVSPKSNSNLASNKANSNANAELGSNSNSNISIRSNSNARPKPTAMPTRVLPNGKKIGE
ncbi:MAG: tetratricopeptide repeat protein [Acidobacteria bacterium]|nr:tetratricopeptide repeat protein [Acidobacteriota bacterium]